MLCLPPMIVYAMIKPCAWATGNRYFATDLACVRCVQNSARTAQEVSVSEPQTIWQTKSPLFGKSIEHILTR